MLLVTGSAGHLGEGLMRTLRAAGRPARGVDLKPSPFTDHVGSILDPGFVAGALGGVRAVLHAATLHKPHVETHSQRAFLDTNVTGTLTLLEAAVAAGVEAFVFTSTTSAFGAALTPAPGAPGRLDRRGRRPGAAQHLRHDQARRGSALRARRPPRPPAAGRSCGPRASSPRPTTTPTSPASYPLDNVQANELLYRRADIADVVDAHLRAVERAPSLGFAQLIVSAPTPFAPDDLADLRRDAPAVVARRFPGPAGALRRPRLAHVPVDRPGLRQPPGRSRRSAGARATTSPMSSPASRPARTTAAPLAHAVGLQGLPRPGRRPGEGCREGCRKVTEFRLSI